MSKKMHKRSVYAIHDANRRSVKSAVGQNEYKADNQNFLSDKQEINGSDIIHKSNSQYDNFNQHSCEPSVIHLRMSETADLSTKISIRSNEWSRSKPSSSCKEKVEIKKRFIEKRLIIADWALFFGMIGFALMIVESEMTMYRIYLKV